MRGTRTFATLLTLLLVVGAPGQAAGKGTHRLSSNGIDDRTTGVTYASVQAGKAAEGNGPSGSSRPSVSADGRFVAFDSEATNLEQPSALAGTLGDDTNGVSDVFLHDVRLRLNRRISVAWYGGEADGPSRAPSISANGRLVVFESDATNLVPGDGNNATDVFVADTLTGEISLVSASFTGSPGNRASSGGVISHDGRTIAFESEASDMVSGDLNGHRDVFTVVRIGAEEALTFLISKPQGSQADGPSGEAALSPDGRLVAFTSAATNLIVPDANGTLTDVFVAPSIPFRAPALHSTGPFGQGDGASRAPSFAGGAVAFESDATNLTGDQDLNLAPDVFLRGTDPNADTILISASKNGGTAKGASRAPAGAPGHVAFVSDAPDLGPPGTQGSANPNVFLASLDPGGQIELISRSLTFPDGPAHAPALSSEALLVAYASDSSTLVGDDRNGVRDVFGWIDETRCANGAYESGPVSSGLHGAEDSAGEAGSFVHDVSCLLAGYGL